MYAPLVYLIGGVFALGAGTVFPQIPPWRAALGRLVPSVELRSLGTGRFAPYSLRLPVTCCVLWCVRALSLIKGYVSPILGFELCTLHSDLSALASYFPRLNAGTEGGDDSCAAPLRC